MTVARDNLKDAIEDYRKNKTKFTIEKQRKESPMNHFFDEFREQRKQPKNININHTFKLKSTKGE